MMRAVVVFKVHEVNEKSGSQHQGFRFHLQVDWETNAIVVGIGEHFTDHTSPLFANRTDLNKANKKKSDEVAGIDSQFSARTYHSLAIQRKNIELHV